MCRCVYVHVCLCVDSQMKPTLEQRLEAYDNYIDLFETFSGVYVSVCACVVVCMCARAFQVETYLGATS